MSIRLRGNSNLVGREKIEAETSEGYEKKEYIRCEECGGFIDKGSCICELSYMVREKIKQAFNLSDEEFDEACDEGRIWVSDTGYINYDKKE